MAGVRNPGKLSVWQERFRRFEGSGLSVGRFCIQEDVSAASFYYWRKKLGQESSPRTSSRKAPAFRPVTVAPAVLGMAVALPGGTRIEVAGENLDVIRTIVCELVRAEQSACAGDARC